jgi:membrane protease YdiL (CAAX protease family)
VVLQAAAFAVAHTSWSVGFGQVPHSVTAEYLLDGAVETAVCGVVFGFLVLELGTVWPAVVAHAVSNVGPMFLDTVPWLSTSRCGAACPSGSSPWG